MSGAEIQGGGPGGPGPPLSENLGIDFYSGFKIIFSCIHFYSGFREKKHKGGGVQFEILRHPGIDFYSGFRKTNQVYTFIVAAEKKKHKGGVQFEILRNPGIDFYSGFRKASQGGGGVQI